MFANQGQCGGASHASSLARPGQSARPPVPALR